ncbi:MAG: hypothetical protein MJZ42_03870, partial [Bacteroidales bacterium]|nr:hypothetical protein [Bacteroidales bacterium]
MKRYLKLIFIFTALFCSGVTMGQQIPQMFNFQAVVRDGGGRLLANQTVGVRISILQGSETGTVVFSETHTPTTNANGLFTVFVGTGNATSGTIQSIDWAQGPYYLKSEVDPLGGNSYSLATTQQLLSVPYALFAVGGDYNNLDNKPDIDSVVSNAIVEYYTAHHVVDTLYDSVYVYNIGYDTIYNRTYDTVFTHSYDTLHAYIYDTVF